MKTNMRQNNKIKFFLKLGLFCSLLVLNEACQMKPTSHAAAIQDEIRKSHANELLMASGQQTENISAFNGDGEFPRYIAQYLKKRNKKLNSEKFTQTLLSISQTHAYDPIFLLAVIQTESSFNFNAVGGVGEIGLMQLKPDTAEWISKKQGIEWRGAQALKDPEYNIQLGAYYFKYLRNSVDAKSLKYVNAYNLGLTSMKRMPSANLKRHPYFGKVVKHYLMIYADLKKMKDKELAKKAKETKKMYFASLY